MEPESSAPLPLDLGHVLVVSLAGAGRLPAAERRRQLQELSACADRALDRAAAPPARAPSRLPVEEGVVFVFYTDPLAPVACALHLARDLATRSYLQARMALHSGPVYRAGAPGGEP